MSAKEFRMFLKMMSSMMENGKIEELQRIVNEMLKEDEPKKGE